MVTVLQCTNSCLLSIGFAERWTDLQHRPDHDQEPTYTSLSCTWTIDHDWLKSPVGHASLQLDDRDCMFELFEYGKGKTEHKKQTRQNLVAYRPV